MSIEGPTIQSCSLHMMCKPLSPQGQTPATKAAQLRCGAMVAGQWTPLVERESSMLDLTWNESHAVLTTGEGQGGAVGKSGGDMVHVYLPQIQSLLQDKKPMCFIGVTGTEMRQRHLHLTDPPQHA